MECKTFETYINGLPIYKDKRKYGSEELANKQAKYLNSLPTQIVNMVSYKCSKCHSHHVGRLGKQTKIRRLKY